MRDYELYLITDDPPAVGDWYYNGHGVFQLPKGIVSSELKFKVVATTNEKLHHLGGFNLGQLDDHPALPKIPEDLFNEYAVSRGTLTEVMVEYNDSGAGLKLTPEGEVQWSPIRTEYTLSRVDLMAMVRNAALAAVIDPAKFTTKKGFSKQKFDNWFNRSFPE